jgi:hypothetical protein
MKKKQPTLKPIPNNVLQFPKKEEAPKAKEYAVLVRVSGDQTEFKFFPPLTAEERSELGGAMWDIGSALRRTEDL